MEKKDLVASVAESTGMSEADVEKAIDATLDSITETLKAGASVRLVGFGTFHVTRRAASVGRNPRTGELIENKVEGQPKFRASRKLRADVGDPGSGG